MSQSLSQLWLHIIFSTKKRYPFLEEITIQQRVHDYLNAICRKENCEPLIVGGVEDHVHLLVNLNKNLSVSEFVEKIKKSSSRRIKTWDDINNKYLKKFYWQSGYGAFSVSSSNLESVKRYIANQHQHHQQQTFQDEFRKFLVHHKVNFKEEYVWN